MDGRIRQGIGVSPGIAIGPALVLERRQAAVPEAELEPSELENEVERLREAVEAARRDLLQLKERTGGELGSSIAQIFDVQLLMLEDEMFVGQIVSRIRQRRQNAEWAVRRVGEDLSRRLSSLSDLYFRERGTDIDDLSERVIRILSGEESFSIGDIDRPVVLVADDLAPSETAQLDPELVLGFATNMGGRTSHTAIMARSLEIPAVVGLRKITELVESDDTIIIDGNEGTVVVRPSGTVVQEYRNKQSSYAQHEVELLATRRLPATTPDGFTVHLMANIESPEEVQSALMHGAEGVGLYRSEFLFLRRPGQLPEEEEHYVEYRAILEKMKPRPVVIRTVDLGGEKELPDSFQGMGGDNALMGLRALRLSLQRRGMFTAQLRGLLRASVHGNLRIILPFVSGVEELREAKMMISRVREELVGEGIQVAPRIPVGAMLEVPAAALVADLLAEEVDFFSVGTNDLIQYLLAVDRSNESVAYLFEPLHPAVLRVLRQMVEAARRHDVPLSLCGEMASDPLTAMFLVGFGIEELSMTPGAIPVIKNVVRHMERQQVREIVERSLEFRTAQEVEEYALEQLMAHFPDGFMVRQ